MQNEATSLKSNDSASRQFFRYASLFLLFFVAHAGQAFADFAYVTNNNDLISVIDLSTNTVVATITVGNAPEGIAITPNGQFAYVAISGDANVSVINTSSNTVVPPPIPVNLTPFGVAITPNGQFAYVVNNQTPASQNVSVIDTSTNTVVGSPIPVGAAPLQIAITPNGAFAYVVNSSANNVSVISTSTNTVVATVAVDFGPTGVAITPDGLFAYVANISSNSVRVINTTTNTVFGVPIGVGTNPREVAITPNGQFVYITNSGSGNVSVIDTTSNTVVATVTVGSSPQGIAITSDGQFAYVANRGDDNVVVIDIATNTLVGSPIPVGSFPQEIAILTSSPISPVQPPQNLKGSQKKNDFGLVFERFNRLKWQASPSAGVTGYFVYRDGSKIATLNASTFEYEDHNRKKGVRTLYAVTAFDASNNESDPVNIEIK